MYRPGEWEQLPSERDLNPFSRYEALDQKRTIVLDDIESTLSETGNWCCETYTVSPFTTGFSESVVGGCQSEGMLPRKKMVHTFES